MPVSSRWMPLDTQLSVTVTLRDGESWHEAHRRAVAQLIEKARRRGAAGIEDVSVADMVDTESLTVTAYPSDTPT